MGNKRLYHYNLSISDISVRFPAIINLLSLSRLDVFVSFSSHGHDSALEGGSLLIQTYLEVGSRVIM